MICSRISSGSSSQQDGFGAVAMAIAIVLRHVLRPRPRGKACEASWAGRRMRDCKNRIRPAAPPGCRTCEGLHSALWSDCGPSRCIFTSPAFSHSMDTLGCHSGLVSANLALAAGSNWGGFTWPAPCEKGFSVRLTWKPLEPGRPSFDFDRLSGPQPKPSRIFKPAEAPPLAAMKKWPETWTVMETLHGLWACSRRL